MDCTHIRAVLCKLATGSSNFKNLTIYLKVFSDLFHVTRTCRKTFVRKINFFKHRRWQRLKLHLIIYNNKTKYGIGYVKVECIDKEFKVQCNPNKVFVFKVRDLFLLANGYLPGSSWRK